MILPGFPSRILPSNMYETQQKTISLLSKPRLLLERTVRQRQHHPTLFLHHHAGQTTTLPLQEMRSNLLLHLWHTLLSTTQTQVFVR